MKLKNLFIYLFQLMLTTTILADSPLITDRPDFTESSDAVDKGYLQVESGYTFTKLNDINEQTLGEILLRVGISDALEARIGINSYVMQKVNGHKESGPEDMHLGLKYELIQEDENKGLGRPAIAFIFESTLPTGAEAFKANDAQPVVKLAAAKDMTENISLGSNLFWAYPSEEDQYSQWAASLAMGIGLTDTWGAYVEYFGFFPGSYEGDNAHYVNLGATYLMTPDLQWDIRFGQGFNDLDTDLFVGAGLVCRTNIFK